ncbi:MAG: hypothetical protein J7621_16390 [Niastella sp.]|nr:hypothetical protein [Niastella sp.]
MSRRKIIIIIILVIIAGGVVTWSIYKRKIVKDTVSKTVADKTNNLYGIKTDKLDIDEVAGNLVVTNLQLEPDSNVYNNMVGGVDEPSVLIKINIPALTVEGVKTPKALLNSAIDGRKVMIHNPRIELFFTGKGKDSLKSVPDKEVYRQILGNLEMIKIDTLSVVNATLITRDWKTGATRMQFDSVTIDLFRIAVDSLHEKDTTRVLFAEEVAVKCKRARWSSKNKLYNYEVREIDLNSGQKLLGLNRFTIEPTLPEQKFLQQFKYATDRFDIDFHNIRLVGLDVPRLFRDEVRADSLVSGKSSLHIYRDLSFPGDGKSKIGSYPHQALMKLPFEVRIKKARFNNSFIEYKERNAKSEQSGKVQFYQVSVGIDNLTSYRQLMAEKPMRVQFNARFLNAAPVKALINFYPDKGRFTIDGSMGSMPATTVNQLTKPMGLAIVEKGTLNSLDFNFNCNDYAADGTLTMLYDDLKITLLKKDTADNTLSKKKFASMLANIQVKNANPNKKGDIRRATVHYDRSASKSFFNLIWKSVFEGVKQSVGISN